MRSVSACLIAILVALVSACAPGTSQPQATATSPAKVTATQPAAAQPSATQPAAAPTAASAATPSYPLTITDDAGRKVTIAKQPQRILSLSASNTEILYALGLESRIVGVDQYSDFPPEVKKKETVGSYIKPDMEKILALEPDLILGTSVHVQATLPELEKRGQVMVIVNPKNVKTVFNGIKLVGQVTGKDKEASTLVDQMQSRMASVEARVKGVTPVRTYFELDSSLHTAGPGTFVNDLIVLAGGKNIAADSAKEWPQLNQEALFLADPEVILLADYQGKETPEQVAARPGWGQISAVKTNRIVRIDSNLTNRPGPRLIDGLEMLADTLHPKKP